MNGVCRLSPVYQAQHVDMMAAYVEHVRRITKFVQRLLKYLAVEVVRCCRCAPLEVVAVQVNLILHLCLRANLLCAAEACKARVCTLRRNHFCQSN